MFVDLEKIIDITDLSREDKIKIASKLLLEVQLELPMKTESDKKKVYFIENVVNGLSIF